MQERILKRLAIILALAGGLLLLSAITMSLASMLGRRLWSTPITGDIELLQMMVAVAVACFLPLCEVKDRHIRVDILANLLPAGLNRLLLSLSHLMLAVVSGLLVWRTGLMVSDSLTYDAQSVQLGVPHWIPQAAMLPGLALLGVCALHQSIRQWMKGGIDSPVKEPCT